jgi:N-acyl-phosphatidylethanolamine-hydrolysing phospholipase D
VAADLAFIRSNAAAGAAMQPAVTWIGHATVLAQMGGSTCSPTPSFRERASPMQWVGPQRAQPPGVAAGRAAAHRRGADLAQPLRPLRRSQPAPLNRQAGGPPLFLVPLGMKAWLADISVTNVVELDWWQSHRIGEPRLCSRRAALVGRGLTDRLHTLWGSWAVFAPDLHLFFAGDTGYSKDFRDIAATLPTASGMAALTSRCCRWAPTSRAGSWPTARGPA